MLEQCWNHSKQYGDNVATLYFAKHRRCELSRVTSIFNNDNGNGSENVTVKVNSCFSKFCRVYSNFPENFKCRPVFLDLNFWGPYSTLKREKNSSWLVCVLHEGDVTRDDSQQRFKCNAALQHCYDILTLCCAKNRREIRHFHVVVVYWRQRNVQKGVMHGVVVLLIKPLFAIRWRWSCCRRPCVCLSSLAINHMHDRTTCLGDIFVWHKTNFVSYK